MTWRKPSGFGRADRPERVERPRREARVVGAGPGASVPTDPADAGSSSDAADPIGAPGPSPGTDRPAATPDDAPRPRRGASLSLKGRGLKLLAQRDHSRLELARKLAPHAESPEALERVLDELERGGFQSERRFADSLVRRRAARYGLRRIEQELGTHRLDATVSTDALAALQAGERDRALAAWRKRFGGPGASSADRAKQHRFLAQRGFTSEAIAWVLRHGAHADDDDTPDEPPA